MDHYTVFARNCQTTLEQLAMAVDVLAEPLATAAGVITAAMLEDHKVICCGSGANAALAQLFCINMLGWQQHERPALPAITLGTDSGALAGSDSPPEVFARQLGALGNAGDALLVISNDQASDSLFRALDAARERNMAVIALSNASDEALARQLSPEDTAIAVSAVSPARVLELHAILLQNLCELIEFNLFGSFSGHHE